jgi:hypothetical protein
MLASTVRVRCTPPIGCCQRLVLREVFVGVWHVAWRVDLKGSPNHEVDHSFQVMQTYNGNRRPYCTNSTLSVFPSFFRTDRAYIMFTGTATGAQAAPIVCSSTTPPSGTSNIAPRRTEIRCGGSAIAYVNESSANRTKKIWWPRRCI